MINKKNVLGKTPDEAGIKDAIHTAIVSVRAASLIEPGQKCTINEYNEAVPTDDKYVGVADPFVKENIKTGQFFWLLVNQADIPNVRHVWEHPKISFAAPTREIKYSYEHKYLVGLAEQLECSYEDLMNACHCAANELKLPKYKGSLSSDELEQILNDEDAYELWSSWAEEVGYEFKNIGTECCPEYDYPSTYIFEV